MSQPFLTDDFHIRWSTLTADQILTDIRTALTNAEARLDAFIGQDRGKLTFDSVIIALDDVTRPLNQAWGLVQHLDSLCNSTALREAQNALLPEVSAFFAKIPLNEDLWDLLLTYSKTEDANSLTGMRKRALDELNDERILSQVVDAEHIRISDLQVARQLQQIPSLSRELLFSSVMASKA